MLSSFLLSEEGCYSTFESVIIYHNLQNLEIKKINDEKKAALAAQFAAEATLRRVHAAQKDDDMPPIEAIITPLEAELKMARQEVYFPLIIIIFLSTSSVFTIYMGLVVVLFHITFTSMIPQQISIWFLHE